MSFIIRNIISLDKNYSDKNNNINNKKENLIDEILNTYGYRIKTIIIIFN